MKPVDEGKQISERTALTRNAKKASAISKQSIPTDEDDFYEKTEVNHIGKKGIFVIVQFLFLEW